MARHFVDTSALVKLYRNESLSAAVQAAVSPHDTLVATGQSSDTGNVVSMQACAVRCIWQDTGAMTRPIGVYHPKLKLRQPRASFKMNAKGNKAVADTVQRFEGLFSGMVVPRENGHA